MKPTISVDLIEFTVNIAHFPEASGFAVWIRRKDTSHPQTVLNGGVVPQLQNNPLTWVKLWDFHPNKTRLEEGEYEACALATDNSLAKTGEEGSVTFTLTKDHCEIIMHKYDELHGETPDRTKETTQTVTAPILPLPPTLESTTTSVVEPVAGKKMNTLDVPRNIHIQRPCILQWDEVPEVLWIFEIERFLDPMILTGFKSVMKNSTDKNFINLERAVKGAVLDSTFNYRFSISAKKHAVVGEKSSFDFYVSNGILMAGQRPLIKLPVPQQGTPSPTPAQAVPAVQSVSASTTDTREIERLKKEHARVLQETEQRHTVARATLADQLRTAENATVTANKVARDNVETTRRAMEQIEALQKERATSRADRAPANPEPAAAQPATAQHVRRYWFPTFWSSLGTLWKVVLLLFVLIAGLALIQWLPLKTLVTIGQSRADAQSEIVRQQNEINRLKIEQVNQGSATITSPVTHLPATHALSSTGGSNVHMTLPSNNSDRAANASINLMGNTFGDNAKVKNHIEINDNRTTLVHPNGWPKGWEPTLPTLFAGRDLQCGIHEFILEPREVQRLCVLPGWYIEPAMEAMAHIDVKQGTSEAQQDHLIGKPGEEVSGTEMRLRPKAHEHATVTVRILVEPLGGCTCPGGHR
jgi:hypothetical protein